METKGHPVCSTRRSAKVSPPGTDAAAGAWSELWDSDPFEPTVRATAPSSPAAR